MKTDYTTKELKLFAAFNLSHLADHLPATILFQMAIKEAFLKNLHGNHVEALRRAGNAIENCSPYRQTPEFEALIEF